ncbi:MAG: hypothetical protein C4533_02820 [Candidatus Omnitrophota bacterium]|jgi:hypothetical protein|nr:MAG: hypothetical protein C4533_02820 [Candidatus Omnitrophota bacterium]
MFLRLGLAVLILFLSFTLPACSTMSKSSNLNADGMLESAATFKFADIPVPAGFKIVPQDSYSFESGGIRVGVLRYQGKADPDVVMGFYKTQMPALNWNLLNVVEFGDRILNFDRQNETCIVEVRARGNSIKITVSLGPKSQPLAKKSKPPLK